MKYFSYDLICYLINSQWKYIVFECTLPAGAPGTVCGVGREDIVSEGRFLPERARSAYTGSGSRSPGAPGTAPPGGIAQSDWLQRGGESSLEPCRILLRSCSWLRTSGSCASCGRHVRRAVHRPSGDGWARSPNRDAPPPAVRHSSPKSAVHLPKTPDNAPAASERRLPSYTVIMRREGDPSREHTP